jgi:hypothetical protein
MTLVAGNFGNDSASGCYDDLAIGVVNDRINGYEAGAVNVLYGSSLGLSAAGSQYWHEDSPGFPGVAQANDTFGSALAAATFRGNLSVCGEPIQDLAIGDYGDWISRGIVYVLYGTDQGLTVANVQAWRRDSPGIDQQRENYDSFGFTVAAGHSASRGSFLVIGAPGEMMRAGAVYILYTDPISGLLTATGSQFYNQDTPGIPDRVESGDYFGRVVATGDYNADGEDDIAITTDRDHKDAGTVTILYGQLPAGSQLLHQDTDIKDVAEPGDCFGCALSQ